MLLSRHTIDGESQELFVKDFDPAAIKKSSVACEALCMWLHPRREKPTMQEAIP